jgi:superfamily II DNA/RNA helicase
MPYKSKSFGRTGRKSHANYTVGPRHAALARSSGRKGPKKEYIAPERFIKEAKPKTEVSYTPTNGFADFAVNNLLRQNIAAKGFVTPSPIQDQTIPLGLEGKDVIGIADTGTGKTAAFAIPILNAIMTGGKRALIVAPTRELAQQIDTEFRSLAAGSNIRVAVLIGGAGIGRQLSDLRRNPPIIIGTPGRIKDHLQRESLRLNNVDFVVLDEVDRMLDMGFINDMRTILGQLPVQRQSFFFSATMDARVQTLIDTFAIDPVTVSVKTGDTGENIHQDIVRTNGAPKIEALHDILNDQAVTKAIIFDDTQRSVERLSKELVARGFSADAIHGGKSQGQRQRSLRKFKDNEVTILVATDVAARGIDVADITHVINYSQPNSYSDYVHRIGRAGRAGKVGYALTFLG